MLKSLICILLILIAAQGYCGDGRLVKGVTADGSCAVVGMTAEQARLTALQNARMGVIEKAAGVKVSSSTVVTDGRMAADFIRVYASGYIVKEDSLWHDLRQYNAGGVPVPEYSVTVTADVYVPEKKNILGLKAELNKMLFREGEKAELKINVKKDARLAVFNIRADDKVEMLYPSQYMKGETVKAGETFIFPGYDAPFELVMGTLEGHKADSEAFLVAVLPAESKLPFSVLFDNKLYDFSEFFAAYANIADDTEDSLIAYTVLGEGK
ncbi:hypothetical protein ADMFC3_09710 [Geovibrio sp. ADMFC3]